MLFSAKFSNLEWRKKGENTEFFIAYSSSFDKSGILFFTPKDENLAKLVKSLALPQNKERLGEYVFKVSYRTVKGQDGSFKSYFNLVGISGVDTSN